MTLNKQVTSETLQRMWSNLSTILNGMHPTSSEYTLSAANWVGEEAPYTYTLTVEGVKSDNVIIVNLANSLSDTDFDTQFSTNLDADIRRVIQSDNTLTFKAYGEKPTIDLKYDISVL